MQNTYFVLWSFIKNIMANTKKHHPPQTDTMIVSDLSKLIILGRLFESQDNFEMDAALPSFGGSLGSKENN